MKITMVKKILADGSPCQKCHEIEQRMIHKGQMKFVDEVLIADERDPGSEGMKLAAELEVKRAPFFVVWPDASDPKAPAAPKVYVVYLKFVREVLGEQTRKVDESTEILKDNPDLDFI